MIDIKFLIDPFAAIMAPEYLTVYEPSCYRPPWNDDAPEMPMCPCRLTFEPEYRTWHAQITRRERCTGISSHACLASAKVAKGEPITMMAGLWL